MINPNKDGMSNFDKVLAAAKDMGPSILEIARRTNTPVIIYRNGKIERLSPDDFIVKEDGTIVPPDAVETDDTQ